MKKAKVAILMSTYNGEKFVSQQIESILNQDFKDFNLYIRDDGSKDKTRSIIKQFETDERVVFIEDNNSLGYPQCFYALTDLPLEEEYIMFSDQDDYWYPYKISNMISKIKTLNNKKPIAYYSSYNICDEKLNILSKGPDNERKFTIYNTLFQVPGLEFTMAINQVGLKLLNSHKPNISISRGTWMAPLFALFGIITYDNQPSACYRRHSSAVTSDNLTFLGLWKWRLSHFFKGGFEGYAILIQDINQELSPLASQKEKKFINLFAQKKHFPLCLKKVFYPKRLRNKLTDEIALRLMFLVSKL